MGECASDELGVIWLVLRIMDLVRDTERKKKKYMNSQVECIHGLLEGLKQGGFTLTQATHARREDVLQIVSAILQSLSWRLSSASDSVAEDMLSIHEGSDVSSSYTDLDIYAKLVLQMVQNIAPR